MRFSELIQLFEAMFVDELLQMSVGIAADQTFVVEHHHHPIFLRVGLPFWQSFDIGVACMRELCPCAAHEVSQFQVFRRGFREFVFGVMQRVEAEFQFMSML